VTPVPPALIGPRQGSGVSFRAIATRVSVAPSLIVWMVVEESSASRRRQAYRAMSLATVIARSWSPMVSAWMVMPASGTSAYGKPKKTLTKTSSSRASHTKARWARSIHGDAPVHRSTVGGMIGTFTVACAGF
jgi:hypothetical protein